MRQCESAPVSLAEYAIRFDLEDATAAARARDAKSGGAADGQGFRVYRHRKDSMRRGAAAQPASARTGRPKAA